MTSPNPLFPTYARKVKNKPARGEEFHYEIETGRASKVLDDGRPVVLDYWYDTDTQLDIVTAYYSTVGIEEWRGEQHKAYLVQNGIMKQSDHIPSSDTFIDEAGNEMWSLNWVEIYVSK